MKHLISVIFAACLILNPSHGLLAEDSAPEHEHEHDHKHSHDESETHEKETSQKDAESHEGHNHEHDEKESQKQEGESHEEHGHQHEAGHGDEHGHEESSKIGPDKGILEFNEEEGFKLAPEAIRNFGLKTQELPGKGPWRIPASAVLYALEEVNLYRIREGHIKRIDFKVERKEKESVLVSSKDLTTGDQVVIQGIGFLRIAELAATGQTPDGHSH